MDDNMIERIFPGGLHILVVDDDATFLDWMKTMLSSCHYKVTACNSPISALSTLLEKPEKFDLLLTDLEMPEMGGRELLKIVKKQLGIPVILMSMDPRKEVIVKGIEEGACYFLQKPISINSIRNLWTHAVWGKLSEDKKNRESCGESAKGKAPLVFDSRPCNSNPDTCSKGIRIDDGSSDKRKGVQVQRQQADDTTVVAKKPRIVWTPELNKKFLEAVNEVGIDKAVPSRITEIMNVEGVDRHHVASHLQKFRIWLKEEKESLMSFETYPRRKKFGHTLEEQEILMSYPRWKKCGRTLELDSFNEPEYMGIRRQSMSMSFNNNPSSIPVLMPPAATHPPPSVNARGTGNAVLGSIAEKVHEPQDPRGHARDCSNINFSPRASSFGATDGGGVNAGGTFLITNPAEDLRGENSTAPVSEFPSADNNNNNFEAPETNSTSACRVAGGLDSSELPMGSNQSGTASMRQENLGAQVVAGPSKTAEVDEDLENFLVEFFKEDRW